MQNSNSSKIFVVIFLLSINLDAQTYCSSSGNGSDGYTTGTTRVIFNSIDNTSGSTDNAYSDYTSISTDVERSQSYNLSVYVDTDSWSTSIFGYSIVNTVVWIDWNRDGDFDEANEEYNLGSAANVSGGLTSNSPYIITIPSDADFGETRMRISTKHWVFDSLPESCDTGFTGEVEDYTINVVEPMVDFDGSDDYVDLDTAHDLSSVSGFSIESWFLQESLKSNAVIISKADTRSGSGNKRGYRLDVNSGYPRIRWWNSSGNKRVDIQSGEEIPINKWFHVAVTFDGSEAILYVNGEEKGTEMEAQFPSSTSEKAIIGAVSRSSPASIRNHFNGYLDEVRIWDEALSANQIREMMHQEIEEYGSNDVIGKEIPRQISNSLEWDNLLGYYSFNDGSSDDSSSYYNHGTATNITTSQLETAPLPYETGSDGDWDNASTWDNSSNWTIHDTSVTNEWAIVKTTHNIDVDFNLKLHALISESTASVSDEEITDSELTIGADGNDYELNISHYLKLDGKIDLQNESQLVQGEGSWLDTDSSGYVERDQQGTANSYTYNYWSSPVSLRNISENNREFSTSDVLRDGYGGTDATIGTIDFASSGTDPYYSDAAAPADAKITTYWLWKFVNNQTNDYTHWEWVGSANDINITEGYTMKGVSGASTVADRQNYVFRGKPNNVLNDQTELVHTSFASSFDANGNPRISLAGNPFLSAIDADLFIDDNIDVINGQLYFWDHWGGGSHEYQKYQGGYAIYTKAAGVAGVGQAAESHENVSQVGSGTTIPLRYIPVGQGFYIIQKHDVAVDNSVSNPRGGDVVFKNSQRIFKTEDSESVFIKETNLKSEKNTEFKRKTQRIRIGFTSPDGFYRPVVVAFLEGATDDFDHGYDGFAGDFLSNDAFFIQDDRYLVIQAFGEFKEDREIPISIFIGKNQIDGVQKIELDAIENMPENTNVYIKDYHNNGETYPINNADGFEIKLEPGEHKDRFALVFQSKLKSFEEAGSLEESLTVFSKKSTKQIIIQKEAAVDINNVTLFNTLGQQLKTWTSGLEERTILLSSDEISQGIYVVSVNTTNGSYSKKVVIE